MWRQEQEMNASSTTGIQFYATLLYIRRLYAKPNQFKRLLVELALLYLFRLPIARNRVTFQSIEAGRLGFFLEN